MELRSESGGVGGVEWGWLESEGLESRGAGVGGLRLGSEGLGSGHCTWFEITLKVLVPCSFLCCFQLPCSWFKSTL